MLCTNFYGPSPIDPSPVSFLSPSLFTVISGCTYSSHPWGEWNDSQLQPTIQKLMKGYNRYLRPNFNGRNGLDKGLLVQKCNLDQKRLL